MNVLLRWCVLGVTIAGMVVCAKTPAAIGILLAGGILGGSIGAYLDD